MKSSLIYSTLLLAAVTCLGCTSTIQDRDVVGMASSHSDISHRMTTFKPLFTLMANTILIPGKWTAALEVPTSGLKPSSSSLPHDNPSLLILTLAVSFIITWGAGLTPPLMIRYAFVRHPLSKKAASWIAAGSSAFLWMAFLVLKSALGEKPGAGVVWVMVFFVSRWIMCREYVPAAAKKIKIKDKEYIRCSNCDFEQWVGYKKCQKCGANLH